jgi:hypothetical protein
VQSKSATVTILGFCAERIRWLFHFRAQEDCHQLLPGVKKAAEAAFLCVLHRGRNRNGA